MKSIPLNLVMDHEDLKKRGDALVVDNPALGYQQLIIVCPGCGRTSSSAGKHKWYPNTQSYTPSIVHDKDLGGCGWHGWLTSGFFTEC